MRTVTSWQDNWSAHWPGHPRLGGLHGFTVSCVISRHDPGEPRGVYMVALSCGPEVLRLTGAVEFKGYAVVDDFGNLVKVKQ